MVSVCTDLRAWAAKNWFLAGLFAAVGLAWIFPGAGAPGGWLHPGITTKLGVALIFFLQGMSLSLPALKSGAFQWRLHLMVQLFTFVVFPLIGLGLNLLLGRWLPADLRLGFLYLCVLPSTISTSVVLTAVAGGNTAAALFNATLSNLLGLVFTPLSTSLLMKASGRSLALGPILTEILLVLLLPMVLGQLCRPWLLAGRARQVRGLTLASSVIILLLVYTTFCESVNGGLWSHLGGTVLLRAVGGAVLIFVIIASLSLLAGRALRFNREDQIAAVFCSVKKTLASGVPMAKLIFGARADVGLILLPIMLYHPLQLILCSVAAEKLRQQDGTGTDKKPAAGGGG